MPTVNSSILDISLPRCTINQGSGCPKLETRPRSNIPAMASSQGSHASGRACVVVQSALTPGAWPLQSLRQSTVRASSEADKKGERRQGFVTTAYFVAGSANSLTCCHGRSCAKGNLVSVGSQHQHANCCDKGDQLADASNISPEPKRCEGILQRGRLCRGQSMLIPDNIQHRAWVPSPGAVSANDSTYTCLWRSHGVGPDVS